MSGLLCRSWRLRIQRCRGNVTQTPSNYIRKDNIYSCRFLSNQATSKPSVSPGKAIPIEATNLDRKNIELPPYTFPKTGILSRLPTSWVPYAELIRLDKPSGTIYLFFPCLFGTLLASSYTMASPITLLGTSSLFAIGAVVMRGAGCTINDLWDRNLDPHVSRTRLRPIARKAISVRQAVIFTGFQLIVGLTVLSQFPPLCFWYATPSLALVATYPLVKRVSNYPQAVLGLAFSWGALVSFPALGVDILAAQNHDAATAVCLLYSSCVCWTILYDMIYAHMDVEDDKKVGIKSIALKHIGESKMVLASLGVFQVSLLASVGVVMGLGPGYYLVTCGGAAITLGTMIKRVKLDERSSCWWWFSNGAWLTGGAISLGFLEEYLERKWRDKN